jgi:hypothetical protein
MNYDANEFRISEMNLNIQVAFHASLTNLTNLYYGSLERLVREAVNLFGDGRVTCRRGPTNETLVLVDELVFGSVRIDTDLHNMKIEVVTRKVCT